MLYGSIAGVLLLGLPIAVAAEVLTGADAQTGLRYWEWQQDGVSVRLVQRLPDQTRAFFLGRGFSRKHADRIASACVFQTIFRDDGSKPVAFDLDRWSIDYNQHRQALRTRERWDDIWESEGVNKAARIAFRWSLLPTRQQFQPGDYNWGMTSFGLPPGARFDLFLTVTIDGKTVNGKIPDIVCASDPP